MNDVQFTYPTTPARMALLVDVLDDGKVSIRWKQEPMPEVVSQRAFICDDRSAAGDKLRSIGLRADALLVVRSDAQTHFRINLTYDDDILTCLGLREHCSQAVVERACTVLRERSTSNKRIEEASETP